MTGRRMILAWRLVAVALVTAAAFRVAWISDDALITLRTALNLSHGWGPGFNATEAVQAYTHPTWFLLWLGIGALTNQWILGITAVSLACTAAATALVAWRTTSISRLILMTGALALSNAFVEYATSGLENSLGFLLLGTTVLLTLRAVDSTRHQTVMSCVLLGLLAAAVFLTRMDFAVLMLPAAIAVVVAWRRSWSRVAIAASSMAVPVLVWFVWSRSTYGAWLPNTYEAKRNVDIPLSELVWQGLQYLSVSLRHDPVTAIALLVGLGFAFVAGSAIIRAWAIGVLLYLGYVVWIGGDFMVGRFLAVPVYLAVLLAVASPFPARWRSSEGNEGHARSLPFVAAGAVTMVGALALATGQGPVSLTNPQSERWKYVDEHGVADERGFYLYEAGRSLDNITGNVGAPFALEGFIPPVGAEFAKSGLRDIDNLARMWPSTDADIGLPSDAAYVCGLTGSWGIVTGPTVHLIDLCGLTDRFIALQTFVPGDQWRPGHFERPVPPGYEDAIRRADPSLLPDPAQARVLADLWRLIRPHRDS